jgi:hypothetical protein
MDVGKTQIMRSLHNARRAFRLYTRHIYLGTDHRITLDKVYTAL